jgi:uncharacterized protein (UPF0332 family)
LGNYKVVSGFLAKAQENLNCADEANRRKWTNAAASRYYYAAYIAMRAFCEKTDEEMPFADKEKTVRKWTHSNIGKVLRNTGQRKLAIKLAKLRNIREQADYEYIDVGLHNLQTSQIEASDFLTEIKVRIENS